MRHAPHIEIDVMGVQIVADIARLAGPGTKRLELILRLAHERREEAEVAQLADAIARIGIDRVPSLVNFHRHEHAAAPSRFGQRKMLFERLDDRLGDQHVQARARRPPSRWRNACRPA